MEENNRKGPGVFYAVVGVATLVVAIIGATFAYFTATASTEEGDIAGQTLDLSGAALTMTAEKYDFSNATVTNKNLVPAKLSGDIAGVSAAIAANCEEGGYTGCHVYKITAGSTETVTAASVTLALSVDDAVTVKSDWKYALFTATDTSGVLSSAAALTTLQTSTDAFGDLGSDVSIDLNYNLGLVGNTPKVYYLMVYLADDNGVQNDGEDNDATGSYTGTVTLNAGADGGKVVATFTA